MGGCVSPRIIDPRKYELKDSFMRDYYNYVHRNTDLSEEIKSLLYINNSNQNDLQRTKQNIKELYKEIQMDYHKKDQVEQNIDRVRKYCLDLDKEEGSIQIKVFMILFEETYLQNLVNNFSSLHAEFLEYLKKQNVQKQILDCFNSAISQFNGQDLYNIDQRLKQEFYEEFQKRLSNELKLFLTQKEQMNLSKLKSFEKILTVKLSRSDDIDLQPLIQMTNSYLQGESQFIKCLNTLCKNEQKIQAQTCPQIPHSIYPINEVNKFSVNPFPSQKSESLSALIGNFEHIYTSNNNKEVQQYNSPHNMKDKINSLVLKDNNQANLTLNTNQQDKEKQLQHKNEVSSSKFDALSTKQTISNQNDEINKENFNQETEQKQQPSSSISQLIQVLDHKYSMPNQQFHGQEKNEQKYETKNNNQENSSSSVLIQALNNKYNMAHLPNDSQEKNEQKYEIQNNNQPNSQNSQLILNLNNKYSMSYLHSDEKQKNEQNNGIQKNIQPNSSSSQLILNLNTKYGLIDNQAQLQESKLRDKQTASQLLKEFNTDLPIDQKQKGSSIQTQALDSNQQVQNAQNIVCFLGSVLNTETS
ncbi:hypothetical protein TTHERM_00534060 (macronuclear) [Tetrahymena thermophila SB210]|uniref:Uncharacterized protein n=1 Tax=Tetrahymena thermophila (strain SB210) TaxID=312017 RepID=Q247W2_TETTS|nr:hypothetical protein TTHERM_00534060 [Tetrahymena thermophila SB210]EAS04183.2 hypothetical protein TTHERM_00534060 [Tetrahymena thermophila SB210]|eukprot:XP_001024428.2 hypothetical protein TTHERM_00534060 [Tetrahymena thermophila SB210]